MPTISPVTTQLDGLPLPLKTRAVVIPAGTAPTIRLTLLDSVAGHPVDLTPYASPTPPAAPYSPLVQLRANEACGLAGPQAAAFAGSVVGDPAAGVVQATIDPAALGVPAIYEAAFGVYDPTGTPAVVNSFALFLEPNLFSAARTTLGPPRVDEVRMRLRDSDPTENRLLSGTLLDDAEIAQALVLAVQAWNNSLPPVAVFDTATFPRQLRFQWIEGACAQLLFMAAEWYRKNYLAVQGAGGVAVADMDRADTLDRAADRRWQQYLAWARQQKVAINASRGFGRLGSPYRVISWGSIMNP